MATGDRLHAYISDQAIEFAAGTRGIRAAQPILELVDRQPALRRGMAKQFDGPFALGVRGAHLGQPGDPFGGLKRQIAHFSSIVSTGQRCASSAPREAPEMARAHRTA